MTADINRLTFIVTCGIDTVRYEGYPDPASIAEKWENTYNYLILIPFSESVRGGQRLVVKETILARSLLLF